MSQHVISIREIIAIVLTMAKRTDLVDRPAPVDGLTPRVAIRRPSTGVGLSTRSVLLAMVSAIAMISRMLINVGNRIIISQGNLKFLRFPPKIDVLIFTAHFNRDNA